MKQAILAKRLFRALFDEASYERPDNPTNYVPRNWFHQKCREAGIPVPENFVSAVEWEESVGLPEYTYRVFAAHHRKHGTDFTPMEKGQWRLRVNQRRAERGQP